MTLIEFRTLDVGCGNRPKGDVNVDLYVEPTFHRGIDSLRAHKVIHVKFISNFIKAEGLHLPFKDNSFETVFSKDLIEHFHEPLKFLNELKRVSMKSVIVKCPHKYGFRAKASAHLHSFNLKWFVKAFEVLDMDIVDSYTLFEWFRPCEIMVEAWKIGEV